MESQHESDLHKYHHMGEDIPGMTLRQRSRVPTLLNCKSSRSIASLQILETVDGDSARARRELQQTRFLLCVPRPNNFPEALNDLILLLVASVVGVFLPVIDVNVRDAADQ